MLVLRGSEKEKSTHKRKCFRYYLFFNAEFDIFKGSFKKLSHLQNDILVSKWHLLKVSSLLSLFLWFFKLNFAKPANIYLLKVKIRNFALEKDVKYVQS